MKTVESAIKLLYFNGIYLQSLFKCKIPTIETKFSKFVIHSIAISYLCVVKDKHVLNDPQFSLIPQSRAICRSMSKKLIRSIQS